MFNLDPKQFPFMQDGESIVLMYDSRWPECYRFILCCPQGMAFRIRMVPMYLQFEQIVKWLAVDDEIYDKHAPCVTTNRDEWDYDPLPIL